MRMKKPADEITRLRARVAELTKECTSLRGKVKRLTARAAKLERFWTPVTESLPPAKVPVWLIDKNREIWIGTRPDDKDIWKWGEWTSTNGFVHYCSDQGWYAMKIEKEDVCYRPTHWALLPQPPKRVKELNQ
jgi:hypothetical protein